MTLDLSHLLDFQALAESGSFSRAAQARNMTQPGFSRRIRGLEEWVGVPLFHRGITPTSLTDAGRALEPTVSRVLATLAQGRDEARAAASRGGSALHFAATHVLSFTFFPNWLRGLEGGQPLEAVQLSSDSLNACEDLMREGKVQFLLCHHHPAAPVRLDPARFSSIRVGSDVLIAVTGPDGTGGPRFRLADAPSAEVPLLAYSEESGLGRILTATLSKAYARSISTVTFRSHLAAALRSMVAIGGGVAWLPHSLIAEDLASSKLMRAADASLDVHVDIHLFRSSLTTSKVADRFWNDLSTAGSHPAS